MISLLPSVISTPINSSSSRRFKAMIPLERGRLNSVKAIFFTTPPAVAMITNLSSSYAVTGKIAVIRSFSPNGKILTIGRPREPRLACGS